MSIICVSYASFRDNIVMFRSRCTYEDYLKSIQNEAPAPEDFILDDESDVETTDEVNDEDNIAETFIDSALVPIPEKGLITMKRCWS